MTRHAVEMGLILGSAALLLGAWGFEYIGGLHPCPLCLIQRWPHLMLIALAGIAAMMSVRHRAQYWGNAALMAAGLVVAVYHSGVERGIFEGPQTCSGQSTSGLSADELFDQIMNAPVVRCSDITWEFLGLSMANWHGLAVFMLMIGWISLVRREHS